MSGTLTDYLKVVSSAPSGAPTGVVAPELALRLNTANNHLEAWDGSAWQDVTGSSGGAAGDLVKLSEQIVSGSAAASITFASIVGTYRHLEMLFIGRGDVSAGNANFGVRFNGDSGANYDIQQIQGNNTTPGAYGVPAQTSINPFFIAGNTAPAGAVGTTRLLIYDYARAVWRKQVQGENYLDTADSAGGSYTTLGGGVWRSTAAITSITLISISGNFAVGTLATLYGRN